MATPSHSHLAGCTTFETWRSAVYRFASLGRQACSSERHTRRKMIPMTISRYRWGWAPPQV
jgi:hypothetical protein